MYCKSESVAGLMVLTHFSGMENMYDLLQLVQDLTLEDLNYCLLDDFSPEYSAVSIIHPVEQKDEAEG